MKRDLWKELARQARDAAPADLPEMPYGIDREVLGRVRSPDTSVFGTLWLPVLRPALVLAMGVTAICLAIQFTVTPQQQRQSDLVSETDALLTTALFDDQ